ncbi:endolytic transglycosylase MltG [Sporosarcina sp. PTS2304]|uniref:endolytic transglycosylase MltG n=1 Tax=Sporosarcina sp. PTS2304 TaxID=2283194 RepID=UPI000E0D7F98|nr:endolytic transglycosylase MltG [Sporosarcina sp. PTS2304]AXH98938.1 endolytic transglycosylase MltG [Sporosarcina sp. PTS2304]
MEKKPQRKKEVMFERMLEQKKEVKTVRKIVFWIVTILLLVALIGGFSIYSYIKGALEPMDPDSEKIIEVEIPIGSGLDSISEILEKKEVIKDARIFKYYAKVNNEADFQAGTYGLTQSMTPDELIKSLKTGVVYRTPAFTLTIPEGLTLDQIAEKTSEKTTITEKQFMDYVTNEETIQAYMTKYPEIITKEILADNIRYSLEGYLFPATYPFYEEEPSVKEVVDVMVDATVQNLIPYQGYWTEKEKSAHWLLTFASLLEKEATGKSDRETIASVFNNRLAQGMPLQTDPTVLYALGEHKDRVLNEDLKVENAYNTYQNKGLPPGPIANTGVASIQAVVEPSSTNYLFFLADKDGKNHFAKTYEEHLKNKAKYIDSQNK